MADKKWKVPDYVIKDDAEDPDWTPPDYVTKTKEPKEDKGLLEKLYDWGTTPLTTKPSEVGRGLRDWIDPRQGDEATPIRSFIAGATEGVGDVLSSMTSPIDLAATLTGWGGAKTGIKGLTTASRALSAPIALHGAGELLDPDATMQERGIGLMELAGGSAGMIQPTPNVRSRIPEPELPPTPRPRQAREITYDLTSKLAEEPVSRIPEPPLASTSIPEPIPGLEPGFTALSPEFVNANIEKFPLTERPTLGVTDDLIEHAPGKEIPELGITNPVKDEAYELWRSRRKSDEVPRGRLAIANDADVLADEIDLDRPITAKGREAVEAAADDIPVKETMAAVEKPTKLPADLAGGKPRFNLGRDRSYTPTFEDDVDKALLIVSQKAPSKRDADYMQFLRDATGLEDDAIRTLATETKNKLKTYLRGQEPGDVTIPSLRDPKGKPSFLAEAEAKFSTAADEARARLTQRGSFKTERAPETTAIERIQSEGGHLTLDKLSPDDLEDIATVGAARLNRNTKGGYEAWSKEMIEEFGDNVKPHLRQIYKASHAKTKEFGPEAPINPTATAVEKLMKSMQASKGLRTKQDTMYRQERSKRFSAFEDVPEEGMAGARSSMMELAGPMKKIERSGLELDQADADTLFTSIKRSHLRTPEKARAYNALFKILEGGPVPQRNELLLLDGIFGQGFAEQAIRYSGGLGALAGLKLAKTANTMKAMMSSVDLSAPLRQGIGLVHTPQWRSNFRDMIGYLRDKESFDAAMQAIRERPNYALGKEAGLFTAESNTVLQSEEAFMSNYVGQIPGIGRIVGASERAYVGFLNKLRADVFDDLIMKAEQTGVRPYILGDNGERIPTAVADNIAKYINVATGRGNLGRLEKVAPELNMVLWSPRLISSRLTTLNPRYYTELDPFTRREAIKSLLAIAGAGTTIMGLGAAAGAEMNANPLSTDFGKARFGNKVVDPWAGYQQYVVAAARFLSGRNEMKDQSRASTLGRFAANKLSPVASLAYELMSAKEMDKTGQMTDRFGNETSVPREIQERFTPMFIQDVVDTVEQEPEWAESIGLSLPALFGVGVQDYPEASESRRSLRVN